MKKQIIVGILMIILAICTQSIFAASTTIDVDTDQSPTAPSTGTAIEGVERVSKDAWATAVTIVQILSVACVVFAGLRYMFSAADQKADIKQGLMYLTIGAVLVFGATLIIELVSSSAETIL